MGEGDAGGLGFGEGLAHLILSQCLLGQVVLPLHLDLHRLGNVGYQEVKDPANGEHHVLGAGHGISSGRGCPPLVEQMPLLA